MDSFAPHDRYFRILFFIAAIALMIGVLLVLGPMPGRRARQRGHPRADSINTLAWAGLVCPPLWICAMWWANHRHVTRRHATLHVPVKPRTHNAHAVARPTPRPTLTPFDHAIVDDDDDQPLPHMH